MTNGPRRKRWPLEIRRNEDGTLDEIVCDGAYIHLEQLSGGCWWMEIIKGPRTVTVTLTARGKITATTHESQT